MLFKSETSEQRRKSFHAIENDDFIALEELRLSGHHENASDGIKSQIVHEQAYGQFAVLRYAAASTFILSSLSLLGLWPSVSHVTLLLWFAATNGISLVRHFATRLFFQLKPAGASLHHWLRLVLVGTVLIALSWAVLVWITWNVNNLEAISLIAFILAAVAFGSYAGLGLYVQAYWGAASPLFAGLAIMFWHLTSGSIFLAIGISATILFVGFGMLMSSLNATRLWRNTMVLLHEHQILAHEHREKSAVLSTTLRAIGDAVFTVDASRLITYINPAAEQLTGMNLQELAGKAINTVLLLADEAASDRVVNLDFLCGQVREPVQVPGDLVLTGSNGKAVSVEVTISPLHIADDLIDGYVITMHDITSLRLLARDLSRQALHDPLTGLLNRRGFESRLREALDRKRTSDTEHSLCYIDLDHFKSINDTHGHKAGDDALRHIVSVAQKCIRDSDSFGRVGGDEFAILFYGCNLEKAEKIASEICKSVGQHEFVCGNEKFSVGISVGLVPMLASDTLDTINHAADHACYRAKANGRGQVYTAARAAP